MSRSPQVPSGGRASYVLITAAYNEEAYIEKTIESVVAQSVQPRRWVIVSDASTDRTDHIVSRYAQRHGFIQLHRLDEGHPRNFGAQVDAIRAGYVQVKDLEYDFIGNLDADVSFGSHYFSRLLEHFFDEPSLGLAGGFIYEDRRGTFKSRPSNREQSVAHAVQLFRRECYESIGGYPRFKYGGPDWYAEVQARMRGWRVQSFADLPVFHHRPTNGAGGLVRGQFRQGLEDYSLGSDPVFEIAKCARRLTEWPFGIGALTRLSGFVWAYWAVGDRLVPEEFMRFLRKEQRDRLWTFLVRRGDSRS
jgi:poly-beta-1,6-N-acetyl-D-glucosamine synthase